MPSEELCAAALIVVCVALLWMSGMLTGSSGLQPNSMGRRRSGFDCDSCSPLGSCQADCAISCRAAYSARENFAQRAENFSPDSVVYGAPPRAGGPLVYTSACSRSASAPLARAAAAEMAALNAVAGGASL